MKIPAREKTKRRGRDPPANPKPKPARPAPQSKGGAPKLVVLAHQPGARQHGTHTKTCARGEAKLRTHGPTSMRSTFLQSGRRGRKTVLSLFWIGVPLAWEKLALGSCITWNGWEINSDRRTAALPRSKRQAVCSQLRDLCEGPSKCSKKSLEKILGLIVRATNLLRFLRPWLSELYACLHTCPATLFSVSRENWAAFYESLKGTICMQEPQRFAPVAKGSQLVQVGRHKIRVFADVPAHAVSDRSAWVRIRNTDSSWVRLSVEARHVLQRLHKVFLHGPSEVSLVQPPISSFSCAADAMASGQSWGIGGWLESDGRLFVFSEKFMICARG